MIGPSCESILLSNSIVLIPQCCTTLIWTKFILTLMQNETNSEYQSTTE